MIMRAENIHKSFGPLHVLKGVDLTVEEAEILSIVGMSGSGKTSFLQILGTLDRPDEGRVIFREQDLSGLSAKNLAHMRNTHFGFIFQFHFLLQEFTALENVAMPAFIAGTSKKDALSEAKRLLDYMGLSERLEHKPTALSGGEQQRVAIARALINRPAIIFADEPTGNLDSQTSGEIQRLFLQLNADMGQTFVIVTHQKDVASISHRSVTISDGIITDDRRISAASRTSTPDTSP